MSTWKVVNIQLSVCGGEGYKIWVQNGSTLIFKIIFKNVSVCVYLERHIPKYQLQLLLSTIALSKFSKINKKKLGGEQKLFKTINVDTGTINLSVNVCVHICICIKLL